MKKVLAISVLFSLTAVFLIPAVVMAQEGPAEGCEIRHEEVTKLERCPKRVGDYCSFDDKDSDCGMCCLMNSIYTVTDWLFIILVAVSVIVLLWGAFSLLTAGGNTEKVTAGRNWIMYAVIGLAVALFVKAIPAIVKAVLGI